MRANRIWKLACTVGFIMVLAGCGPSKAEREAKERAHLELEEKSRHEAAVGNKAITGMNQKLGRKPPDLNLGVPPGKPTEPVKQLKPGS